MTDVQQSSKVEQIAATSLAAKLQKVPLFDGIPTEDFQCLDTVEVIHADVGADLFEISALAAASGFCWRVRFACRGASPTETSC